MKCPICGGDNELVCQLSGCTRTAFVPFKPTPMKVTAWVRNSDFYRFDWDYNIRNVAKIKEIVITAEELMNAKFDVEGSAFNRNCAEIKSHEFWEVIETARKVMEEDRIMTLIEQKKRYETEADFHALVQMMEKHLLSGTFSISELKGAANLASMRVSAQLLSPMIHYDHIETDTIKRGRSD